jgi:inorganic triphosphatase YgiF
MKDVEKAIVQNLGTELNNLSTFQRGYILGLMDRKADKLLSSEENAPSKRKEQTA